MTPNEYQVHALRTMADQQAIRDRNYSQDESTRLTAELPESVFENREAATVLTQLDNAARGMAGDVGEVNTCVQRCLEYGRPLDLVNLKEELGDVLWRIVQACDAVGLTLEEVMAANIAKLRKRYPEKYTDALAAEENRDREAERKAVTDSTARRQVPAILNDVHSLSPEAVKEIVRLALDSGNWRVDGHDQCVACNREDESWAWAANWKSYAIARNGSRQSIRVPHWLARRMYELDQLPESIVSAAHTIHFSFSPTSPNVGEPSLSIREQTGHGFAEPPEEAETSVVLARDSDYPVHCEMCGKVPVHKTNTLRICPDCYPAYRRKQLVGSR